MGDDLSITPAPGPAVDTSSKPDAGTTLTTAAPYVAAVVGVGALSTLLSPSSGEPSTTEENCDGYNYMEAYSKGLMTGFATSKKDLGEGETSVSASGDDSMAVGNSATKKDLQQEGGGDSDDPNLLVAEAEAPESTSGTGVSRTDTFQEQDLSVSSKEDMDVATPSDETPDADVSSLLGIKLPYPVPINECQVTYNQKYQEGYNDALTQLRSARDVKDAADTATASTGEKVAGSEDMDISPAKGGGVKSRLEEIRRALRRRTRKQSDLFHEYKALLRNAKRRGEMTFKNQLLG
jgi:hypothetical protein